MLFFSFILFSFRFVSSLWWILNLKPLSCNFFASYFFFFLQSVLYDFELIMVFGVNGYWLIETPIEKNLCFDDNLVWFVLGFLLITLNFQLGFLFFIFMVSLYGYPLWGYDWWWVLFPWIKLCFVLEFFALLFISGNWNFLFHCLHFDLSIMNMHWFFFSCYNCRT